MASMSLSSGSLIAYFENSVIKCIYCLTLLLGNFGKSESCSLKITYRSTVFFKSLCDIVNIMMLDCGQIKIVIYILSIWTCPDKNMLVFTFPLVMWAMGPSNIILQKCWNLQYSSRMNSLFFHFGTTSSVTFAKLKDLYSFTMTGFAGSPVEACSGATWWTDGDWGGGFSCWPPVAWVIKSSA